MPEVIQIDRFISTRLQQDRVIPVLSVTPPFPQGVVLELTTACNHACSFCKNPTMTRPHRKMSWKRIESVLTQARALGATELGLSTTGDPFMAPLLEATVRLASALGYTYIYASTNGALATPERVERVLAAGLTSLKFSINAGTRQSYAAMHGADEFDLVLRHLAWVVTYRARTGNPKKLGVTMVETLTNRHELPALVSCLTPFVDEVYISPCGTQVGYMMENVGVLAEVPRPVEPPCRWLWNRVHVTAEGYLTLCCVDYQNYLAIEDLAVTPLAEAWHSARFQELRRQHLEHDLGDTLCAQCLSGTQQVIAPRRPEWATAL